MLYSFLESGGETYVSGKAIAKAARFKKQTFIVFAFLELLPLLLYRTMGFYDKYVSSLNVVVPLGISFFSLQAVTYSYAVYKGELEAENSILNVILFVSFFPCVSSGPIERAVKLLPQIKNPRKFNYDSVTDGLRLIGWGLLKKLVLADNLAAYIVAVRSSEDEKYGLAFLLAAVLYSFQLYLDFSGYSDIVIGCAKALGFEIGPNFDHPYLSGTVGEFWRRWHISLSSWLRDFIYIPLGGNRKGHFRKHVNTLITFLISGIWHGAGLTWILWGAFHGLCICLENAFNIKKRNNAFGIIVTYVLVTFGWILFSSADVYEFVSTISLFANIPAEIRAIISNFGRNSGLLSGLERALMIPHGFNLTLYLIMLLVFIVISVRTYGKSGLRFIREQKTGVRWCLYFLLALTILFFSAENSGEFIYNRF